MAKRSISKNLIKVGVVGIGRGQGFARGASEELGMKLVALCDTHEERLAGAAKELGVAAYTDYDKFLEHDLDAVVLANFFHQHAPFAIKALRAGKHVMSETSACFTMAQGVELVEAVEKSGRQYMFAENYPYMLWNQEMRRVYQAGLIGEFIYGEGEYVHPEDADFWNSISPGVHHWRNWLPSTYYCTHAMAPLMYATDTMPVRVNAFSMPYSQDDQVYRRRPAINDASSQITVRMDSGAICKLLQFRLRGHGIWYRLHGSRGAVENLRHGNEAMVRLRREQYHEPVKLPKEEIYLPNFPKEHMAAHRHGHGGGDYFMNYHFAQAIRTQTPPYLDVYRGVAMSVIGIQGWRSALEDSASYEIPNFRDKKARDKYRNDNWNPEPKKGNKVPCSVKGHLKVTPEQLAYAKKIWRKHGYFGE